MKIELKALTQNQIENIHELTMQLLWKYGIEINSSEAREKFKKNGGIIDGRIVKIPKKLVDKALETVPSEFEFKARNQEYNIKIGENHRTMFVPTLGPVYTIDRNGNRVRVQMEDLINFLKLSHTSNYCDISCSMLVFPEGDNPHKMLYNQMLAAIKYSDKLLLGLTSNKKVAEDTIEMARISTGFDNGFYVLGSANGLSPMAWDENMLDSIKVYAEAQQPLAISVCSMAGFTSHISVEGTLISNNAEILSGIVYSQLCRSGAPVIYGNTSTASDMKTMGLAIGAPEAGLISTAAGQLARFYGVPYRGGGGLSDAKDMDTQAGIEAATNLFLTVGNNVDIAFHSLGIMDSFNTISYHKWIMDEEILGRIYAFKKKMKFDSELVDIIGEIGNGNYLQQKDTMMGFRDAFFMPEISDRNNYSVWESRGVTCKSKAIDLVNERLESYVMPELDSNVEKELNRICDENN